jgi:hypothetical protein
MRRALGKGRFGGGPVELVDLVDAELHERADPWEPLDQRAPTLVCSTPGDPGANRLAWNCHRQINVGGAVDRLALTERSAHVHGSAASARAKVDGGRPGKQLVCRCQQSS